MRILPISQIKDKINEYVEAVSRTGDQITITKNGAPAAAVRVKADETVAHFDLMNASGVGLLIQAVVGSFGGAGFWCRNRAGLAV